MTTTNATTFRNNLASYLNQAIDYNDIININTKKGNVIVLSEQEYEGLLETAQLLAIPKMKEKLMEGIGEKAAECVDFEW